MTELEKIYAARGLELRKALQLFAATLDANERLEDVMEIATLYPKYEVGKAYKAKTDTRPADIFSYGVNSVGDPQLYMVLQDHTSAAEWTPDKATSLYKAIGITEDGYAEWVQPLGASDAYDEGNIVSHKDKLWVSTCNANVWEPGVYGWEEYTA